MNKNEEMTSIRSTFEKELLFLMLSRIRNAIVDSNQPASHRGRRLSCKYINSNVFNFDAFTRVYPTWRVHVSPKRKKKKWET